MLKTMVRPVVRRLPRRSWIVFLRVIVKVFEDGRSWAGRNSAIRPSAESETEPVTRVADSVR